MTRDVDGVRLLTGDAYQVLATLPDDCVDCVVTSPPYWGTRDYGVPGQYGREAALTDYLAHLRAVFVQVRRVLKPSGTVWLNLGDSYSTQPSGPPGRSSQLGHVVSEQATAARSAPVPHKNLLGIPWRLALALQDDGWILRSDIIWHKPNGMPESVRDRPARKHEYLFLLTKSPRYYFDLDAIRTPYTGPRAPSRRARPHGGKRPNSITTTWPNRKHTHPGAIARGHVPQTINQRGGRHNTIHPKGANPGTVWSIATRPTRHHHYAAFPIDLPLRAIAAGCPPGGVVLDPFSGAGTTILAAHNLGREAIGIDIQPAYHDLARERLQAMQGPAT
ncbi:site-specific DNA-methyltransferase [Actinomadura darangshiensis]|uniref:Methyltransferase n=2 Tax=Actinomadura darangshiensis TaxID=705336 RepID=A0A4R5A245_9ACTN|nr:site-specific DNA-methyltransferase [Actinomadura darangshiensis]